MVFIGMSYTFWNIWNTAFQWKCSLLDMRRTRICILFMPRAPLDWHTFPVERHVPEQIHVFIEELFELVKFERWFSFHPSQVKHLGHHIFYLFIANVGACISLCWFNHWPVGKCLTQCLVNLHDNCSWPPWKVWKAYLHETYKPVSFVGIYGGGLLTLALGGQS